MASSSLNVPRRKYDVFLSFRGVDTRRSIVSHLLKSLKDEKIEVFSDYKLEEGNEISPTLLKAIEEFYISLIIFSKGFADSKWCLEELEKIVYCMENYRQVVVPIFYDVNPSSVRHQKECYGDAIRRQEEKFKQDSFKIQSWKTSLTKAANLSGFDSSKFENDAELVKQIVNRVWDILKNIMPPNDSTKFIGVPEQIAELESLLSQRQQDVHIIGIWGMGGIGKTTIASLLFQKLSHEYEGCHFLGNVREELGKCGITQLKNTLISKLLGEKDLDITIPTGLPFHIQGRLRQKKVLVVLDDVDDSEQLQDLTGACDWFGPGSTIITTSRDKSVLNKYCSKIYEVTALKKEESLELFSLHAFKKWCVKMEGSDKLSLKVVDYAKGNPLALKVLGSFFNGKNEAEWTSGLEKLGKMPHQKIQSVLKLSYDTLDQSAKDIFLYIACFFKGFSEWEIVSLLDSSLHPTIELRILEDKALITTSYGMVTMHDLIQDMGRQIVRDEFSKDPSKYRHLWDHNDINKVFKNNSMTVYTESISLRSGRVKDIHLGSKAFKGMTNLKYLHFECPSGSYISDKGGFDSLPEELKYFDCAWYPFESLPSKLSLKNLVKLDLYDSKVKRLWNGTQDLGNLKEINLSHCEFLEELSDMSKAPKLEYVDLSFCIRLRHVHPSVLSNHNLVTLSLYTCRELCSLKSRIHLRSLKYLIASNCSKLKEFSMSSEKLIVLDLQGTSIENNVPFQFTLGLLSSLTRLYLEDCVELVSLPASIKHLSNLEVLSLDSCSRLRSIPELPPSINVLIAPGCISLEAVFTSNSSRAGSHLNPRYPFFVKFHFCQKLGEDTVNAVAMDFVLITMGAVYQQPTPNESVPYVDGSMAILPLIRVPNVLNFRKSRGCESEISIQVTPDLMAFIFCFAISQQPEDFELLEELKLLCCCFVHVSNGETKKYHRTVKAGCIDGDNVVLWYNEDFNGSIVNGIKESRALSSSTDEYTKVSFEIRNLDPEEYDIKEMGVYPIYASELHRLFSSNTKRSRDTAHSREEKKRSKKLKAT